MTTLEDRFSVPPPPPQTGIPCSVGHLLATLPEEDAKALQYVLDHAERGWTAWAIKQRVEFNSDGTPTGLVIGHQSIGRHRRGGCRCFRSEALA